MTVLHLIQQINLMLLSTLFGGPAVYFGENGLRNRGNDANFLRNIIDPPPLSLVIGRVSDTLKLYFPKEV